VVPPVIFPLRSVSPSPATRRPSPSESRFGRPFPLFGDRAPARACRICGPSFPVSNGREMKVGEDVLDHGAVSTSSAGLPMSPSFSLRFQLRGPGPIPQTHPLPFRADDAAGVGVDFLEI